MAIDNEILAWDAPINDAEFNGCAKWHIIEPGDYDFEVMAYNKIMKNDKPALQLDLEIDGIIVTDTLYYTVKAQWKICALMKAVGQNPGNPLDFNALPMSKGRCKVKTREYVKNDGSTGQANEIAVYFPKADAPAPVKAPASSPYSF